LKVAMSSMLVRHPMHDETAGPRAGGFGLASLFQSSRARLHPACSSEENEEPIEVGRRAVPVVSLRLSGPRFHDDASSWENDYWEFVALIRLLGPNTRFAD
jgi:hypothetical protein